jgi:predicted CoA-binding protein
MCNWFKSNVFWDLPGEVCMDEGFHVFPVNFEANSFFSYRGELKYDSASNFAKWIDMYQMYRESIAVISPSVRI